MATVIDSLVVTLGLDPKSYIDGSRKYRDEDKKNRDVATESARRTADANKKAAESFGQIKREALGLFATIVGARGIEQFVVQTVKGFTALDIAAKQAGLSFQQLGAYQNMIARNGGDAGAAGQAVVGLANALEQWRALGQLDQAHRRAFSAIGVSRNDNALDVTEKFAQWAGGQKDKQYVALMGRMAGLNPDMIDKAMQGGAAHKAGMAESLRLGVPTEDQAKKTRELQNRMEELSQAVKYDAQMMVVELAPALTGLIKGTAKLVTQFPQLTQATIAATVALWALAGLKTAGGLIAGAAGGAGGAAGGGGILGRLAGWAGLAALRFAPGVAILSTLIPTEANKGEMDTMRRYRAAHGGGGPSAARTNGLINRLMGDLGLTREQASGVAAHLIAESGLAGVSERHPLVPGSKGGIGWGQWTGERRKAFEAYAAKHGGVASDEANYGFLIQDLRGAHSGDLARLKRAKSATGAALAFAPYESGNDPRWKGNMAQRSAMANNISVGTLNLALPGVKDAAGLKRDLPKVFASNANVNQANSGLQ